MSPFRRQGRSKISALLILLTLSLSSVVAITGGKDLCVGADMTLSGIKFGHACGLVMTA